MSSDLERVRALALKSVAKQADERKKKEIELLDKVRTIAKAHLPHWVKSIDVSIRQDSNRNVLCLHYSYRHDLPFGSPNYYVEISHAQWTGESKNLGPQINLDELFKIPLPDNLGRYAYELTLLLGKPFRVVHDSNHTDGFDNFVGPSFTVSWG